MELELSRVDYTTVGITNSNCLQLVPGSLSKDQHRIAVGDAEGILQVFSLKRDDIHLHFKTLPGPSVQSVRVAGASGTLPDKIFVASGNEVKGYTKKGKLFLTFEPGMTEPISMMYVLGNELFLCGNHNYVHFRDCKEVGSCLCGDKIVDVIAFYAKKTKRLTSLIACEGRTIRVLEHARITLTVEVESTPTILHIYEDEDTRAVLFGTVDGKIGILDLEISQGSQRWLISSDDRSGSISSMASHDLNSNGMKQLIIGRQDGNIEVFQVRVDDELDKPNLIFSYNCNESITSLQCGTVGSADFDEIIVATYTGRIFGLTTQPIEENLENDTSGHIFTTDTSQKVNRLKSDIEELKNKIIKERGKYQSSTLSYFNELSAIPLLMLKDSFLLDKESSTYNLSIELPTAIDNILIQSNTQVELMDVEKNSAVTSYSDSSPEDGNLVLATYRCQINTNRLELRVKTVEGQKGTLTAYVTPMVQPKCSRVIKYDIKALSLHYRIHQFDNNRPFNVLTIKGNFSLAEIHSWITQCLPEVPEKPQISQRTVLWFKSNLLGTTLECNYEKREAEFRSDSISTISALKENITEEATKKKIKVDINTFVNDESINFVLKSQEEKVLSHQHLEKEFSLRKSLQELEVTEEETVKYLSQKYKSLLKDKFSGKQDNYLETIYGAIVNLYTDYNKFKGITSKHKTEKLRKMLESYCYEEVLTFFRPDYEISKD